MILYYYSRLIKKLHLVKYTEKINKILIKSICAFEKGINPEDVNGILDKVQPNPKTTSICKNTIETNLLYDLCIIVPAYNVEKYINECIDSILIQQTKYKYKIIIVEDGATDNTSICLQEYENLSNIKIIHQENRGLSGARNRGLEFIEARFVMFVDSDDSLPQGTIESLLTKAYDENSDIVEGEYNRIIGDKLILGTGRTQERKKLYGFPWGKVYKSSLFSNIHFPEKYWFEDTVCSYIIYTLADKISFVCKAVYNYRINPNGITQTSKGKAKSLDTLYITESLLRDREELKLPFTQETYEFTLRQFQMNFRRTYFLGNIIRRCVFYRQCNILKDFFCNYKTEIKGFIAFEKALRKKSYEEYYYSVLFEI